MIIWIMRQPAFVPGAGYGNWDLAMHFAMVLAAVYPISYLATRFIEEPIKGFMRDYIDPKPVKKDAPQPAVVEPTDANKTTKVD